MIYNLGFAKTKLVLDLDETNVMAELLPNKVQFSLTGVEEVKRSLEQPIGSKRLKESIRPGEKVVIITSDITRPMPSAVVLPPVLEELHQAGIADVDITIVFAMGIHRAHTEEEKKYLVASAGGYPKDINLYQAQKALDNAKHAVKKGGSNSC